jgi:glycosyltransferase involved in cell wall biosynthesis
MDNDVVGRGTSGASTDGPRISVIIPTHNRAELVPRAVRSALRAIAPGDEVVVVDDGSTDSTGDRLAEFDGAIRYHRTENLGAGPARNLGVRMAAHDWIAFLDSDDEWFPDHLDLHRTVLSKTPALFTCANFDVVEDDRLDVPRRVMQLTSWTQDHRSWSEILGPAMSYEHLGPLAAGRTPFCVHVGSLYKTMLNSCYVATSTVLVRRDVAGEALRFAEDLPTYEDYDCFIRLARAGQGAHLDCATVVNHGHDRPRLSRVDLLTAATTRIAIMERNWGRDTEFLSRDEEAYSASLLPLKQRRIRELVLMGRTREARREMRGVPPLPWQIELLSRLPGPVMRLAVRATRLARAAVSPVVRGTTPSAG